MGSEGREREWWAVREAGGSRGEGVVSSEGGEWSGRGVGSSLCPPCYHVIVPYCHCIVIAR